MEILIKLDKRLYEYVKRHTLTFGEIDEICDAITNGTPLPEGHGRLVDADKTLTMAWTNFYKHEDEWEKKDNDYFPIGRMYDQNGFECCQQTIVNAPTIIEANKEE